MRRSVLLGVLALIGLACPGKNEPPQKIKAQPRPPGLQIQPAPGVYEAYQLTVTAVTERDHVLYVGLDEPPELSPTQGYRESFRLTLVKSTRLFVNVQRPNGGRYGPYVYEYLLRSPFRTGNCAIAELPKTFYRGDEPLNLLVQYVFPAALSRLEIALDGVSHSVPVKSFSGVTTATFAPLSEGAHTVQCRVVSPSATFVGNVIDFIYDHTPPSGTWLTSAFVFNQNNWRNELQVEAADGLSGLAEVSICNAGTGTCITMLPAGGPVYTFATAMTDATRLVADVYVHLVDRAGNVFDLPQRTVDFLAYSDPVPSDLPLAITYAAQPIWNLAAMLPANVSEVRHFDGSSLSEPITAVSLSTGWNEFLFRISGSQHWHSYGVYQAGVEVHLPAIPNAQRWLVYASVATVPAMQAKREDVIPMPTTGSVAVWKRPWFEEIPHVFFVADDGDGRWTEGDSVYVDSQDNWSSSVRAWGVPLFITSIEVTAPTPPGYGKTVTLDIAPGLPQSPVFFEWRADYSSFPAYHKRITATTYPVQVTVPTSGLCHFFLDLDGGGTASAGEPRSVQSCSENTFLIASRDGPLAVTMVAGYPLPWVKGMLYGSSVTASVVIVDETSNPVVTYPIRSVLDVSGLGSALYAEGFEIRYPNLSSEIWFQQDSYLARWTPAPTSESMPSTTLSVYVVDQVGSSLSAVVFAKGATRKTYVYAPAGQWSLLPVDGSAPYSVFAVRDGYLSEKAITSATNVTLRLLAPTIAGAMTGVVRDALGRPLPNAEITWESNGYFAATRSDANGNYRLPVTAAVGELRIQIPLASGKRTVNYAIATTTGLQQADWLGPTTWEPLWPMGLGSVPDNIVGPSSLPVVSGGLAYSAIVTGATSGTWQSRWSTWARNFTLPGGLPGQALANWHVTALPSLRFFMGNFDTHLRCGDWRQPVADVVFVHADCWAWLGQDEFQTYILGLPQGDQYPSRSGLGGLLLNIYTSVGGIPVGSQLLDLHEQILPGRKIRVRVENGIVSATIPAGVYRVTTSSGTPLYTGDGEARVKVWSDQVSGYTLWFSN